MQKRVIKTNLSLIDDIKKIYAPLGGKFLSLESDLFEVIRLMSKLKQEFEQVSSKAEKVKQMAKDLGANEALNIIKEFENGSKQRIKDIDNYISKIQ